MLSIEGACDWRIQLHPDSRQRILNKTVDMLRSHLPASIPERMDEIWKIARWCEEKSFNVATSQSDYLRKLSLMMLSFVNICQRCHGQPSNQFGHDNKPPNPGCIVVKISIYQYDFTFLRFFFIKTILLIFQTFLRFFCITILRFTIF
ncbi:mediator of RNA polymerase II transcription subunit 15a [Gastrolobium bilobum]|uniref:mediator of RNA polymerase II transcription subunit 15a n=1 Tax=Gastrolobium bilobum TaxID=150636 RepID=UPI002AB24496|nr:mediator of RNA polymerase II transcription subunit 15a [Gastrolobium bilobum]